ncbi:SMP-30/gluconolactonase/LRE family protein [Pelagibacteraceae bacterium]|nr:SMP-30/gluconolactonase/LRE family protein [Pelagibacteraceae bacterium]
MFDIDIINSKTTLGESGFYLYKSNEIVFLDLLNPHIFFYSIQKKELTKIKLNLSKPLGNVYPLSNGKFVISCFKGLYLFDRKKNKLRHVVDIRTQSELKNISYNDGTITSGKLWIGLCHIKETENLGYFGYYNKNKFKIIDRGFKVSNGPAIDEKKGLLYFSDSFNSSIYQYNLKNLKKKNVIKFNKKFGFPDGIALDNQNGLWVAHWAGAQVSRINLKSNKIDFTIKLPALNITSVTFVGKDLSHLFITTAKIETADNLRYKYNYSGSSFIIKTNFNGLKIPYSSIKF